MRDFHKLVCLIFSCILMLSGCASKSAHVSRDIVYYPSCEEPLLYLADRGGTTQAVAKGATTGALITGITTLIAGAISGRIDPIGVVGSVGAGAVVGGAIGGANNSVNNKNDTRQMSLYLEEIDGDITDIDTVEKAGATLAKQCYGKAFTSMLKKMETREISQEAALARFDEILAGMREADTYLDESTDIESMKKEFANAEK